MIASLDLSTLPCTIIVPSASYPTSTMAGKRFMLLTNVLLLALFSTIPSFVRCFNGDSFSLSAYQKARAVETSRSLDASRLHFQILFVDDDNVRGRIAQGLLARIAEHNDAMCVLFPASTTVPSYQTPPDAAAPVRAVQKCESLGIDDNIASAMGTLFDKNYLDEYDLILCFDDDLRTHILRSLPGLEDQEYYAPKCRLLSEFLSPEFCNLHQSQHPDSSTTLRNMVEADLLERVDTTVPEAAAIEDQSSNVFANVDGADFEAAMIMACAGLTRFCLDTIDTQFESAFFSMLDKNFYRPESLSLSWEKADDQLRLCNSSVTGYFSPKQRRIWVEKHMEKLRDKLSSEIERD